MKEITIGHISAQIEALDKRITRMDDRLQVVEKVTQFGKGAVWTIFRLGALVTVGIAAWEWFKK